MEPALWHDGGVFPHSNVTSVHNQIHKIIQDHTGQTVKMGQIYVQFSKHNCGNIGFYLSHYLILLSHFLIHFSWNMWCLMYKGKHAHFWMEGLDSGGVQKEKKNASFEWWDTDWSKLRDSVNNLSLPVKVAGLCFCGRLSAGVGAICVQIWVYKWP